MARHASQPSEPLPPAQAFPVVAPPARASSSSALLRGCQLLIHLETGGCAPSHPSQPATPHHPVRHLVVSLHGLMLWLPTDTPFRLDGGTLTPFVLLHRHTAPAAAKGASRATAGASLGSRPHPPRSASRPLPQPPSCSACSRQPCACCRPLTVSLPLPPRLPRLV